MTPEREVEIRFAASISIGNTASERAAREHLRDVLAALDAERAWGAPFKSEEGYEEHWRGILQLKARNAKLERVAKVARGIHYELRPQGGKPPRGQWDELKAAILDLDTP